MGGKSPAMPASAEPHTHRAAPADPMAAALALAEQAVGLSDPNPRVGCVIVSADGRWLLGQGHTQAAGSAHAEIMALRDAQSRGLALHGATAHVTLEPCAHQGRTPPCCEALIAAGLGRVVVAARDPNPAVDGQGMARLRAAGMAVEMAPAAAAEASRELNIGFFSRMQRGRPWLRLKIAASVDGRTALPNGHSQWITGPAARADGHAWRRRAGAVLSGSGTVLADNPRLDVRLLPTARQPARVIVDSQLRTPTDAALLQVAGPVLFCAADPAAERIAALQQRGAEVIRRPDGQGRVDLGAVLAELHRRQINEVHVEAGAQLNGAWLASGLVDECLLYLAPLMLGAGRAMADLGPYVRLDQALQCAFHEMQQVGADLRLRLRPVAP